MGVLSRIFGGRSKPKAQANSSRLWASGYTSGFEAAKSNRLTEDWNPGTLSPAAIHRMDGRVLRERARDLALNNPLAKSGVDAYIANVIECGITPKPRFEDRGTRQQWLDAWNYWAAHEADATGIQHFYELQALFLAEVIVGGGCLVHKTVLSTEQARGRRSRAAITLIPEERFADDKDTFVTWRNRKKSENPISRGIEVDAATGRPLAYWIYPTDPNADQVIVGLDPVRIPADQCHYAFFRNRIGQLRGYTLLHAAIMWLWKLGYYTDNELMASAIKSCFSAVIKTEDGGDDGLSDDDPDSSDVDAYGNRLEKLQPGIVSRLKPGEDIVGVGPNTPAGDSTPWLMMIQRSIAAGIDLSYEELCRDYSKGSFSSVRAACNADRKRFRKIQRFVIQHFCQPVYRHWVTWEVMAGRDGFPTRQEFTSDPEAFLRVEWRAPGWISVNPLEDAKAQDIRLNNATLTREKILADEGEDVEEVLDQVAREQDSIEQLGIELGEPTHDASENAQSEVSESR